MSRPTVAEINLLALKKNVKKLKKITRSKIYPVVKANAYGHGLKRVIETINNYISGYCVATFEESIELRRLTSKSIVCMEGPYNLVELKNLEKLNIDYVIHSNRQISFLAEIKSSDLSGNNKIWLKVDTGMNRLGFKENEILKAFTKINSFKKKIVLMSHFSSASANTKAKKQSNKQIKLFKKYESKLKKIKPNLISSLCNSGGLINFKNSHMGISRPGISIFGCQEDLGKSILDLEQVMTLKSKFISIKRVQKGELVGYEGTWRAKKDTTIGILPIGYADGYPTGMGNSAYVLVDNKKAKVIGRVSMDLTAVDLSRCVQANFNSEVILWGSNLKIDKVAKFSNTISYELMTSVSKRVKRKYIEK